MKCRKHQAPAQLSLFEPRTRWCDLPLDTRQRAVDLLAQLLGQNVALPTHQTDLASVAAREQTSAIQETDHDPHEDSRPTF